MYGGFAVMKKLNTTILNFTVGILEHVDKDLEKLRDCPIYLDLVGNSGNSERFGLLVILFGAAVNLLY